MTTAARVLQIARGELGTTESPRGSNRTKYGAWYGMNGQPWCDMFVSWVLAHAGGVGYRSAYTPAGANHWKSQGRWHTGTPVAGDIAYFDFPDSKRRIQHVGIVESATGTTVTCIEGNTSSGSGGSQDNGGGVFRRTRPRSHVVGFGRPAYSGSGAPPAPAPAPPSGNAGRDRNWFGLGDSGADVRTWQHQLNYWRPADAQEVDGEFGPLTLERTRQFQHDEMGPSAVDGQVGPATIAAMERMYARRRAEAGQPPAPAPAPAPASFDVDTAVIYDPSSEADRLISIELGRALFLKVLPVGHPERVKYAIHVGLAARTDTAAYVAAEKIVGGNRDETARLAGDRARAQDRTVGP